MTFKRNYIFFEPFFLIPFVNDDPYFFLFCFFLVTYFGYKKNTHPHPHFFVVVAYTLENPDYFFLLSIHDVNLWKMKKNEFHTHTRTISQMTF